MFLQFLLLGVAVFQLAGQQTGVDQKEVRETKAKAAAGNAVAQYNLGVCYATGEAVAKDEAEAVKWFRKAAAQNLAQAQYNLGACYSTGAGVAKDEAEAAKWYRKAAAQNFAMAQFYLGFAYANGQGVAKNQAEAVKWYRKAAGHNLPMAQYNLGVCYENGQGVTENQAEAVKWLQKAAEQRFAVAQYNLGVHYLTGEGVAKDRAKAVTLFRKAADQNLTQAQNNLGDCYSVGEGVARDYGEALKWYHKAAEQNDATGQYNLGVCYEKGEGVEKDHAEAMKWYRKAAEQNLAVAQYSLGVHYATGDSVTKDTAEAKRWWALAAAQGLELAKEATTALDEEIAREQRGSNSSSAGTVRSRPKASGTGFFITEDGYLITNEHVAGDGAQVRLVTVTGITSAKVVKVDSADDLALLKVSNKQFSLTADEFLDAPSGVGPKQGEVRFAALPVVSSRPVKLGSSVATIGFPDPALQGFAPKFTRGEIGSLSGPEDDARYFQISVPVQPGNSGGALVNERGNVVGVVCAKLSAQAALSSSGALPENVNYAIKSSFLLGFLESVPEVAAKLKEPNARDMKPEDVAEEAKEAAVLVLVY